MLSSLQATCAKFSCRNNNVFHFLMHSFLRFSILIVNSGGIKVKIPLCLCQDITFSQSIHHILDKIHYYRGVTQISQSGAKCIYADINGLICWHYTHSMLLPYKYVGMHACMYIAIYICTHICVSVYVLAHKLS